MGLLTATQKEAEAGFSLNLFIKILWVSHFLPYGLSLLLCMESQLLECKCSHPVSLSSTAAASETERPPGGLSPPHPSPGTDGAVRGCWLRVTHHLGELTTDRWSAAVGEWGWALPWDGGRTFCAWFWSALAVHIHDREVTAPSALPRRPSQ